MVSGGVQIGFFFGIPTSATSTTNVQIWNGGSWSGAAGMAQGRAGHQYNQVRLNDGRVGYAQQGTDATWNYTLVQTPEQSDQIHALFDAFKKNIRVGLFTLPSAF